MSSPITSLSSVSHVRHLDAAQGFYVFGQLVAREYDWMVPRAAATLAPLAPQLL